jgi:hypothetical protein
MYECIGWCVFDIVILEQDLLTPSMKMEQSECSETSAHKIHTPANHPKERIQHSQHGEVLQSRIRQSLFTDIQRT